MPYLREADSIPVTNKMFADRRGHYEKAIEDLNRD
jgi:hypothetical protein